MKNRDELSQTFDRVADTYQDARPEYPEALFDHVTEVCRLDLSARLFEIGCATGKATIPMARRGFHITCVERGSELAAAAAAALSAYPNVVVHQSLFEEFLPEKPHTFDLVYVATAWHWIDPSVRYQLVWNLLRPNGHFAFWGAMQVFPEGGDPFFREIQTVYDEIGEGLPANAKWPRLGELPESTEEICSTGLFEVVEVRQFDWEIAYDATSYIALLETFSGHIAMQPWQQNRLYSEIRQRLGKRPDGKLRRHWGAVLHIARCCNRGLSGKTETCSR